MRPLRLTGGQVLLPGDGLVETDIALANGVIDRIGGGPGAGAEIDARGLLVLPGIVDIHGDAFERQLQPRPGIEFPVGLALRDTEAQLLANGITTAFHGVTLSWEPGLRSLNAWHDIQAGLAEGSFACDMRVHLRWEAYNLDALDDALAAIAAGRVHLLAFNDHTPSILKKARDPISVAKYADRAGMKAGDFIALAERVGAGADRIPAAHARLAQAARAAAIPMASHDDYSIPVRDGFRAHGARISEFPLAEDVGHAARAAGDHVVMGCPNVVRGKSHLGWASAAAMAEAGVCTVLASDYFYPAMLRAAFVLVGRGSFDLARAWNLVSANPAAAAQLHDRGTIAPGKRADIVLVDPAGPAVVASITRGRLAYLGPLGADRIIQ